MADKVRNHGMERGHKDSLKDDAFSESAIPNDGKMADPRDVASFTDVLAKKEHGGEREGSGEFSDKEGLLAPKGEVASALGKEQSAPSVGGHQNNLPARPGGESNVDNRGHADLPNDRERPSGKILDRKDLDRKGANKIVDHSRPDVPEEIPPFHGVKILESMAMQRIDPQSTEAANIIKSLGVQVAEKIIASYEALNAKQEVRVTLQNDVLKDTEVLISKDGKSLNVNFVTGSDESASILTNRSGELKVQLMERLSGIDRIDIEVEHQSASDNQDNDGRSRNRHGNQREDDGERDSE